MEFYKSYKNFIDPVLFVLGTIVCVYLFKISFPFFAPFLIGFLISMMFEPLSRFFETRLKISRPLIAAFDVVILLTILTIIIINLIATIISQGQRFIAQVPQLWDEINFRFELLKAQIKLNDYYSSSFGTAVANNLKDYISSFTSSLVSEFGGYYKAVTKIPSIILGIVLTFISSFFFIKDKALFSKTIKRNMPPMLTSKVVIVKRGLVGAVGGYIRAQLTIMFIIATICVVGLTIIRYPYALFVGILIAFVDALPIFGSGAIIWPWALYSGINGDYKKAVILMIIYGTILLVRQIVEPKILGREIGIHPLMTLVSIYVGLKLFGVVGLILGPIVAVVINTLLKSRQL